MADKFCGRICDCYRMVDRTGFLKRTEFTYFLTETCVLNNTYIIVYFCSITNTLIKIFTYFTFPHLYSLIFSLSFFKFNPIFFSITQKLFFTYGKYASIIETCVLLLCYRNPHNTYVPITCL